MHFPWWRNDDSYLKRSRNVEKTDDIDIAASQFDKTFLFSPNITLCIHYYPLTNLN